MVKVIIPKTLKFTQNSVEKFRQIISLTIDKKTKNNPHRFDNNNQILSSNSILFSNKIASIGFFLKYPKNKIMAKIKLIIVGFILIKYSSFSKIVSPPNTEITTALNNATLEIFFTNR